MMVIKILISIGKCFNKMNLPSIVELFFFLLNLPVNLLSDLSKLQLGTKDLVLFLL